MSAMRVFPTAGAGARVYSRVELRAAADRGLALLAPAAERGR
jgi:hypothetical protein